MQSVWDFPVGVSVESENQPKLEWSGHDRDGVGLIVLLEIKDVICVLFGDGGLRANVYHIFDLRYGDELKVNDTG